MTRVFIHPLAGVLSAYGMGLADLTRDARAGGRAAARRRGARAPWRERSTRSARDARGELDARASPPSASRRTRACICATRAPTGAGRRRSATLADDARARSKRRYRAALRLPDAGARADRRGGVGRGDRRRRRAAETPPRAARARGRRRARPTACACTGGALARRRRCTTRDDAAAGRRDRRPGDHRRAQRHDRGRARLAGATSRALDHLVLERVAPRGSAHRDRHRRVDPVHARGVQQPVHVRSPSRWALRLQNTAYSVNIKERLDFSCALFDAEGNLIANAPHMPVHLGSMGESDQDGDRARTPATMQPGDVYVLNDPYNGGTHLPDVTVDHARCSTRPATSILFYVGSRGHHADIGGITPGSMPPFSHAHRRGGRADRQRASWSTAARFREAEMRALLRSGALPGAQPRRRTSPTCGRRSPPTRRACRSCARWSRSSASTWCSAYMRHVQDNAEESVRRVHRRA